MGKVCKIVFLGAGSAAFGISLYRDLFSTRDLSGSTLVLVDPNRDALDRMAALAETLNRVTQTGLKIEKTHRSPVCPRWPPTSC